jgi:hypothetical protein
MAEVQADAALDALGVDRAHGGRPSITGSAQTSVWDYLPFTFANADERFTRYPHLTLSIQRDRALAQLILPDKLDGTMRWQILSGGYEAFRAAIARCIEQGRALSNQDPGAVPSFEVLHRHYVTRQRSTLDAHLEFDPRTAFSGYGPIKRQEEWLRSAYDAFADKRSNLQIGIGAAFRYGTSTTVSAPDFARSVVAAWCATAPVLDLLRGAARARPADRPSRPSTRLQNAPRGLRNRAVQAAGARAVRVKTTLAGAQETRRG